MKKGEFMAPADNNLNAANALRAKVFKILTGEQTPQSAFLSYAPGGLPQSEATLKFLKDSKLTDEAFAFERIADSVPIGVGDWVQSTTILSDIYTDWPSLRASTVFTHPRPTEEAGRRTEVH